MSLHFFFSLVLGEGRTISHAVKRVWRVIPNSWRKEGVDKEVGQRRQGRFSNRMYSRGHDLGLTRYSAFPAEAASRYCLSLLLADLRGKLSFSFTSPFWSW
jgi:hypothetical protein